MVQRDRKKGILPILFAVVLIGFLGYRELNPPPPDRVLFMAFYKEVMQTGASFDDTYRPFADALAEADWVNAASVAKKIDDPLWNIYNKMKSIKVPNLKKAGSKDRLMKGMELLQVAYLNRINTVSQYLEFTNNPAKILSVAAEIKNSSEDAQRQSIAGIMTFFFVANDLGIQPDELKIN